MAALNLRTQPKPDAKKGKHDFRHTPSHLDVAAAADSPQPPRCSTPTGCQLEHRDCLPANAGDAGGHPVDVLFDGGPADCPNPKAFMTVSIHQGY